MEIKLKAMLRARDGRLYDLSGLTAGNYNVRLTVNGARSEQRLMVK